MIREKEQAVVLAQEQLAEGIFSFWIKTRAAKEAVPGQFISVYTEDRSRLLPRPISICEIDGNGQALRMVYRVTGENTGTKQFSRLRAGDRLPVMGPLGNGFPLEKAEGKKAFLMGGGIGVPPIRHSLQSPLLRAGSFILLRRTAVWGPEAMCWMRSGRTSWRRILSMPAALCLCSGR